MQDEQVIKEEQGWLAQSRRIVQSLRAMRPYAPTEMEEEQTHLEKVLERLEEARAELKAAKLVLEMDDPRLLKAVQTIERVLKERDEARSEVERLRIGQKAWASSTATEQGLRGEE
jgi:hypothetical protein